MGVYIKGMEMPTSCRACRFAGFGGRRGELNVCMFTGESQPTLSPERMSACPIAPVPPHGRLIDADGEVGVNVTMIPGGKCKVDLIAPTIIPAEGGE